MWKVSESGNDSTFANRYQRLGQAVLEIASLMAVSYIQFTPSAWLSASLMLCLYLDSSFVQR